MTNSRTFYCNGCFASQHESPLIALPGHIFLCSDCVDIAHETLHEKIKGEFDGQQPDEAWSDDADSDSAAVAEAIRAREEAIAQVSGLQLQVAGLVEALEAVVAYDEEVEDNDGNLMMHYSKMIRKVREALAAHRKGAES